MVYKWKKSSMWRKEIDNDRIFLCNRKTRDFYMVNSSYYDFCKNLDEGLLRNELNADFLDDLITLELVEIKLEDSI